jgi:hypothetical protein
MQYGHLWLHRSKMESIGVTGLKAGNGMSPTVPESCGLTHVDVAVSKCRELSVML